MFNRILIANRGEIACRIIKTTNRLGIESVAIYSTADRHSMHVSLATEAYCVGSPKTRESYLNIEAIINIARRHGVEAIHPGYGFLSENPAFAQACEQAGLVFIGPSIHALEIMGSKQFAKQQLEGTGVPLTPGYHGVNQSNEMLLSEALRIGFPVLLKASNGGGGKGMRAVHALAEFDDALAGVRRESLAYFGDETVLIEKLIENPRHVEMQIMADHHGHVVHLFERDCSIQRRHQKIIEEAPAPNLSKKLRENLAQAAISVARAIDYRNAGTIEFLVANDESFYFMEMNTRLQVEHPVTEMITGIDLVEWQLRIAANEPLPCMQEAIHSTGHAIECRIYAEDPRQQFLPSIGQISVYEEPTGAGIRVDSGIACHSFISRYYDPMIAKLIAWGSTRDEARQRLQQALSHYYIGGIKTNIPFLKAILNEPNFITTTLSTNFLVNTPLELPEPNSTTALYMAACLDYLALQSNENALHVDTFGWQLNGRRDWLMHYRIHEANHVVRVTPVSLDEVVLTTHDKTLTCQISLINNRVQLNTTLQQYTALVHRQLNQQTFYTHEGPITVETILEHALSNTATLNQHALTAPMPAMVVAVLKQKGDLIKAGEGLMVLEAMKMEHTIYAPHDGLLTDIFYALGQQVNEGALLVSLERAPS